MAQLLTDLGAIVTQILTWVGSACTTIVGQPLLLLGVGFFVIGGSIGITGRLIKKS